MEISELINKTTQFSTSLNSISSSLDQLESVINDISNDEAISIILSIVRNMKSCCQSISTDIKMVFNSFNPW